MPAGEFLPERKKICELLNRLTVSEVLEVEEKHYIFKH
jgi:hypothetical protein